MNDDDTLSLTSPIASSEVFGRFTEAIEYNLTNLIAGIHTASDYQGLDAVDNAMSLMGSCHDLMGLFMAYHDHLSSIEKYKVIHSIELNSKIDKSFDDFFIAEDS